MDPTTIPNVQFWSIFENLSIEDDKSEQVSSKRPKLSRHSPERLTVIIKTSACGALIFNSPLVDPRMIDYKKAWYQHEKLELVRMTNNNDIRNLATKYPHVKSLDLSVSGVPSEIVIYIIEQLRKWSANMVTLRLWVAFSDQDPGFQQEPPRPLKPTGYVNQLFDCINAMPALKRLHLDVRHFFIFYTQKDLDTFPIHPPALEELYIYNLEMNAKRRIYLKALLEIPSLQRVGLETTMFLNEDYRVLSTMTHSTSKRFFALNLVACKFLKFKNNNKLKRICQNFPNLTRLSLTVLPENIENWSKQLATLRSLKILWLTVEFDVVPFRPSRRAITQLKVKVLKLDLIPASPEEMNAPDLKQLMIYFTFPKVKLVRINLEGYLNKEKGDTITKEEWISMVDEYLQPLTCCEKIDRVAFFDYTNFTRDCNIAEL